jgi:hypothetical protein
MPTKLNFKIWKNDPTEKSINWTADQVKSINQANVWFLRKQIQRRNINTSTATQRKLVKFQWQIYKTWAKDKGEIRPHQLSRQIAQRRDGQFRKWKKFSKGVNLTPEKVNLKRETYMEGKGAKL